MNTELMHYGVKGMKWGVRRSRPQRATTRKSNTTAEKRTTGKVAAQTKSKPKPKKASEMTDSELDAMVKRMRLEAEYNRLRPKEVSIGKSIVDKILKDVVVPAATEVGKNELKKFMESTLDSLRKRNKE